MCHVIRRITRVYRYSCYLRVAVMKEHNVFPLGDVFSFIPTVMMRMGSEMKQTVDSRFCFVFVSS
jgi:hypothetical protein